MPKRKMYPRVLIRRALDEPGFYEVHLLYSPDLLPGEHTQMAHVPEWMLKRIYDAYSPERLKVWGATKAALKAAESSWAEFQRRHGNEEAWNWLSQKRLRARRPRGS